MEQNLRNVSSTLLNHELLFKVYLAQPSTTKVYQIKCQENVVHYNLMNDKTDLITHQQDVASLFIPGHYTLF